MINKTSRKNKGHLINIVNFEQLLTVCKGYGIEYQPSSSKLTISSLEDTLSDAKTIFDNLKTQKTAFDNAVNEREIVFTDLRKLSTRIINSLAVSDASSQTLQDAKSLNRKMQGKRAKAIVLADPKAAKNDDEKPIKHNAIRQSSFNRLLDNFNSLLKVLEAETSYKPKEADLKLLSLQTLATSMNDANISLINVADRYQKAQIARNQLFYLQKGNLVDTGQAVKKYVRSLFGSNSPMFKQVLGISFQKHVA